MSGPARLLYTWRVGVRLREDFGSNPDTIDLTSRFFCAYSLVFFARNGIYHVHGPCEGWCENRKAKCWSCLALEIACLLENRGVHENWKENETAVNQAEAFARLGSKIHAGLYRYIQVISHSM